MITIGEISEEVLSIVQDNNYNLTDVLRMCNNALLEISGLVLLPDLQAENIVYTAVGVNYAAMPSDFQRNLYYCYSEDNLRRIKIYDDFRQVLSLAGVIDQPGYVYGVAVRGRNLHYQRIPSAAETLQVYYYRNPTVLIDSGDTPDCLPVHLARPLLVNYCCKELFSLREDGTDGETPNTDRHTNRFNENLGALLAFVGPESRIPKEIPQSIEWDLMTNA
jgi:hypothetical protein